MNTLSELAIRWGGDKTAFSNWLDVQDDGLHVFVGVAALLVLAIVTNRRMDDWRLWSVVFVAELANEAVDLSAPDYPEANWAGATHDLILTMILPTLILLFLRFTDRRGVHATASTDSANEANSALPSTEA